MSIGLCHGSASPGRRGFLAAALLDDMVAANHIVYDQRVVDGYGHVSVRHDKHPNHYPLARAAWRRCWPPGRISIEYAMDSVPVAGCPTWSGFIHGEVYTVRPDVIAIVHSHLVMLTLGHGSVRRCSRRIMSSTEPCTRR